MPDAIKSCIGKDPAAGPEEKKHFVKFKLVDDAGSPAAGITVSVTLPDKAVEEHTSSAEGLININLAAAGECTIDLSWEGKKLSNSVLLQ